MKTELSKFYRACGKYRYMKVYGYELFDCKIVHEEVQNPSSVTIVSFCLLIIIKQQFVCFLCGFHCNIFKLYSHI